jgi:hypothetical protein
MSYARTAERQCDGSRGSVAAQQPCSRAPEAHNSTLCSLCCERAGHICWLQLTRAQLGFSAFVPVAGIQAWLCGRLHAAIRHLLPVLTYTTSATSTTTQVQVARALAGPACPAHSNCSGYRQHQSAVAVGKAASHSAARVVSVANLDHCHDTGYGSCVRRPGSGDLKQPHVKQRVAAEDAPYLAGCSLQHCSLAGTAVAAGIGTAC